MQSNRRARRVVIVDDSRTIQALIEHAFSVRSGFDVIGVAADATSAAAMIRELKPDIVTIDFNMPYLDGSALLAMIEDISATCKIVVSDNACTNDKLRHTLMSAGASVCLSKTELARDPEKFFKSVDSAFSQFERRRSTKLSAVATVGRPDPCDAQSPARFAGTWPLPRDEDARLALIRGKGLANTIHEPHLDRITRYLAQITKFPMATITFIDKDRQWIKSGFGIRPSSCAREHAFCNYTISQGGTFVVADAAANINFRSNPLVLGSPHIRTYVGHSIQTKDGTNVGSICVLDSCLRTDIDDATMHLQHLSAVVSAIIDERLPIAA